MTTTPSPSGAQSDLAPCPFCSSAAEQWKHHLSEGGDICPVFHVGCRSEKCDVAPAAHIRGQWGYPQKGDLTNEQAQEKAITAWNRRAAASAQATAFDGDSEVTRKAFREYDAEYPVSRRSHWQIWRDAIAYAVKSGIATPPSPDAREAGGGAMTDEQHQSMEFAIALLEGRGYTGRAKDLRALLRGAGSD